MMNKFTKLLLAFLIISYTVIFSFASTNNVQGQEDANRIIMEEIKIPGLSLKDDFDYSAYYGVIRSQKELDRLWSNVSSITEKRFDRKTGYEFNVQVPAGPSPVIDFSNKMVLWFAVRGVPASFVKSAELAEDNTNQALAVTVHVVRSDFLTSELYLWKIPKTEKAVSFNVESESNPI